MSVSHGKTQLHETSYESTVECHSAEWHNWKECHGVNHHNFAAIIRCVLFCWYQSTECRSAQILQNFVLLNIILLNFVLLNIILLNANPLNAIQIRILQKVFLWMPFCRLSFNQLSCQSRKLFCIFSLCQLSWHPKCHFSDCHSISYNGTKNAILLIIILLIIMLPRLLFCLMAF